MALPVIVRQVWRHNLDEELSAIARALPCYPFVAIDTNFPGRVFASQILSPYQLMKLNVDSTEIIQFGLALCDANGTLALCDDNGVESCCCWEFNFMVFYERFHLHNTESIELLKRQGIDFNKNGEMGITTLMFRSLMSMLINSRINWVTFDSAYDFGYLVKILSADRILGAKATLPHHLSDFMDLVKELFGDLVFDVKHMIKYCYGLYGGLERVAKTLGVYRVVGKSQLAAAGSNSLLTLQTFMKLKQVYFNGRSLDDFKCVIHGLTITDDSNEACLLKDDKNFQPGRDWAYVCHRRSNNDGPFKVVAKISPVAYCLDTAPIDTAPIHKVFHVSVLMKWLGARPPDSLEYNIKPKEVLARGVATWATGAVDPNGRFRTS